MKLKELQEKIQEFVDENDLDSPAEARMLDLVSEVGEVSKEMLRITDYGKKPLEMNKEVKGELGDILYSLIVLANKLDVDLEEALELVLDKYKKRLNKGELDSRVEE